MGRKSHHLMERVYAHLSKNGCRKFGLLADPELTVTQFIAYLICESITKVSNTWSLQSCTLKVQLLSFHYWIYFVFSSFHCTFIFSFICFTLHNCIFVSISLNFWMEKYSCVPVFTLCPLSKKRGILLCTCRSVDRMISVQYLENVMIFHNGLVMNRRRPLVILRSRSFRIGNGNINILIILSLMDIKYCILVHHN